MGLGAGDDVPKSGVWGRKPRRAGCASALIVASPFVAPRLFLPLRSYAKMSDHNRSHSELVCPCCGARLTVDAELRRIIAHQPPPSHRKGSKNLDRANQVLRTEAARREAHFRQSADEERIKSQLLERKFEEALRKSKDQPVTRPTREIDLD